VAAGGTGGIDQALDFQRGIDIGILAVAVLGDAPGVEGLEAGGHQDGPDLDLLEGLLLREIDGLLFPTGLDAGLLALVGQGPRLKFRPHFRIDQHHLRGGLGKGNIDRLAFAQASLNSSANLGSL